MTKWSHWRPSISCDFYLYSPINVQCHIIVSILSLVDEIKLNYLPQDDTGPIPVGLIRKGIAWESDKEYKFKNPDLGGKSWEECECGSTSSIWSVVVNVVSSLRSTLILSHPDFKNNSLTSPKDWGRNLWELDTEDETNNGLQNEDLIIWMRTAALPNFRKLYRKINHTGVFENGLPKGTYRFDITYRKLSNTFSERQSRWRIARLRIPTGFEVTSFSGTKSIILSTTSILGGKNPFLGIAYITVGAICLIMGMVFLFIHVKCGKQ